MTCIARWSGANWDKLRSMVDPIVHLSRSAQRARGGARLGGEAQPAARSAVRSGKRSRPMTAGQEVLFFAICFSIAVLLQMFVLNS
jgi:hypothetical protein